MSDPAGTDWVENAVLVYGPRKAGTTLFQNLLDGGEELFVYPHELKLKYFVKHPPGADILSTYWRESRIPKVRSPLLDLTRYAELWKSSGKGELPELVRRDARFVLESCGRKPSSLKLWAAKEVGGRSEGIFRLWRALFPQGRMLFILRDPRMVTRAVLNERRRLGHRPGLVELAREVIDPAKVAAAQARWLTDPAVLAITYEDLVADTPETMRRVAAFLGISYGDFLSYPSIFGASTVVATASQSEKSVFRSDAVWHKGLTRRERLVVGLVSAMLRLLGRGIDYPALRRRLAEREA
ncbi:MAG: sulfotransferase [Parvibaculaceae bacterium]